MHRAIALILLLLTHELWGLTWLGCPIDAPAACSQQRDPAPRSCCAPPEEDSAPCCAAPSPAPESSCCRAPRQPNSTPAQTPAHPCRTVCVLPPGVPRPEGCPSRCCVTLPDRPATPNSSHSGRIVRQAIDELARAVPVTDMSWGDAVASPATCHAHPVAAACADARTRRATLCVRTI